MSTLIYSPSVEIHIASGSGVIDVSEDIVRGDVHRKVNAPSSLNFDLLNQSRKYDGIFAPMDRVVCYLRRTRRLLVFSGYLNTVPRFSAVAGNIHLDATDTLKRLQNFVWDPHSAEGVELVRNGRPSDNTSQDGGMSERTIDLLNKVAGWPREQIHISTVPPTWFNKIQEVANDLIAEAEKAAAMAATGATSTTAGQTAGSGGVSQVEGIGPGTGFLPATSGRCTQFGGTDDTKTRGKFALTGEQYPRFQDPWYCAMRWPYVRMGSARSDDIKVIPGLDIGAAKAWWKNRKILVTNPTTGKSVVVRAADWGPAAWTGNAIDVSPAAMQHLSGNPRGAIDTVNIAFAPADAKIGPVGPASTSAQVGTALTNSGVTTTSWGDPGAAGYEDANIVTIRVATHQNGGAGVTVRVNKRCAAQFTGFLNELSTRHRIDQSHTGGYVKRPITGGSGWSNHAYGAGVDVNWNKNPYSKQFITEFDPAWVRELAHKWGLWWGGDYTGTYDTMHFEAVGAPRTPKRADQYARPDLDGNAVSAGTDPATGAAVTNVSTQPDIAKMVAGALFNVHQWAARPDFGGNLLPGIRALMNDQPIMETVDSYMRAALRSYSSAPNGDFIAWFPDYYGWWGTAGKIVVADIEIEQSFSVGWSDDSLKTHFFVTSSTTGVESLNGGGDASATYQRLKTSGIASVEMPELMRALFNSDDKIFANEGRDFLNRFGARPHMEAMNNISGGRQEFFFAVFNFMQNWAQQFNATIQMTFLPEVFPGMLMVFPIYGVQAYVEGVTHSFDLAGDGFTTRPHLVAWSTIGNNAKAVKGLPKGAPL